MDNQFGFPIWFTKYIKKILPHKFLLKTSLNIRNEQSGNTNDYSTLICSKKMVQKKWDLASRASGC